MKQFQDSLDARPHEPRRVQEGGTNPLETVLISVTSSMCLVETPARHISIIASSTFVSSLLQRSKMAVIKRIHLCLGMRTATSPDLSLHL